MKLTRRLAIAFLVDIGFEKAGDWPPEKIESRLRQVPSNIKEDQVSEKFLGLYESLGDLDKDEPIQVTETDDGSAADTTKEKEVKSKNRSKKEKKASEKEVPEKKAPAAKAPAAKGKKDAKPEETEPKKSAKPAAKREKGEVDAFNCRLGTISTKVNKVMTSEWMDEDEIIEKAGVTREQALGRLYYGREAGHFEVRRLVQYRLKKA